MHYIYKYERGGDKDAATPSLKIKLSAFIRTIFNENELECAAFVDTFCISLYLYKKHNHGFMMNGINNL